jgi:hypothetical protein
VRAEVKLDDAASNLRLVLARLADDQSLDGDALLSQDAAGLDEHVETFLLDESPDAERAQRSRVRYRRRRCLIRRCLIERCSTKSV